MAGDFHQKWEYICAVEPSNKIMKKLDELGEKGWELVHLERAGNDWNAFLKRPLP